MKGLVEYALVAVLATEAAAGSHHRHRHIKKGNVAAIHQDQSPKAHGKVSILFQELVHDKQGNYVKKPLDGADAKKCLDEGTCVIVDQTSSKDQAPPPALPSTTVNTETTDSVPQSAQQPPASSSQAAPPPPPPPAPTSDSPSSHPPQGSSSSASGPVPAASASSPDDDCDAQVIKEHLEREFPNGKLDCSVFPDGYGPIRTSVTKMGWSGIQNVPDYQPGSGKQIVHIRTAPFEEGCTKNSMCSYACPAGWQKSQWPLEQGSKGESVGGIYCDSNGKLQLTQPSQKTLCESGKGGVKVENKLNRTVVFCRTDYPGTETMGHPTVICPGQKVELTNPDQSRFLYGGNLTSAHYYLNPGGVNKTNACLWLNPNPELKDKTGDNAPAVCGTGVDPVTGNTFMGCASNDRPSALDYRVVIREKGAMGPPLCEYEKRTPQAGKPCTVSVPKGREAMMTLEELVD